MNLDIQQYRAAIGTFYLALRTAVFKIKIKRVLGVRPSKQTFFLYFNVIIHILLIVAGVHQHPGPDHRDPDPINFKCCHLNARSLLSDSQKMDEIRTILCGGKNDDAIAISETWLKTHTLIDDDDLTIDGYHQIFRKDRPGNERGGGVAIFIKDHIPVERLYHCEFQGLELIWLKLKINHKTLVIGCCYRKPNALITEVEQFVDNLSDSLDMILQLNPHSLLLLADMNDKCRVWSDPHINSELGDRLVSLLLSNNLYQLIQEPTRENSILDLLITDSPGYILNSYVNPPLATLDHCLIGGTLAFKHSPNISFARTVFDYKNTDFLALDTQLIAAPWELIYNHETSIDVILGNWYGIFWSIFNKHVPQKIIKIRTKNEPWFTRHLNNTINQRNKLYRHRHRSEHDFLAFQVKRREVSQAIFDAKKTYYDNFSIKLIQAQSSSTFYWSLLKQIYGDKIQAGIPSLIENNNVVTVSKTKASILNNYFADQSRLPENDSDANLEIFEYKTEGRLDFIQFEEHEVHRVLTSLSISKANGPDLISNRILKECAVGLTPSLCGLYNHSLQNGSFPTRWKEAHVTAIFKKDDRQHKANYRPISLLSCVGKAFERLIFNRIYKYCVEHNILTSTNSGSKPSDSAVNQLVALVNKIYQGLDDHKEVMMIFLDVSKAFDKVWHRGLLHKLKCYGISGTLLKWFSSYLSGRKQRVALEGVYSEWRNVEAGFPQGSILGPLLFLFYINDIVEHIESDINLFADDTSLLEVVTDPVASVNRVQRDLNTLENWAKRWRVTFNATKTDLLIISLKQSGIYMIHYF